MDLPENYPLPARILLVLRPLLFKDEKLLHLIKTAWKPRAGIPTLWLALTDQRFLLFSARRGHEIFVQVQLQDMNSIRIENGNVVHALMHDVQRGDLRIPFAPENKHLLPYLVRTISSRLEKSYS